MYDYKSDDQCIRRGKLKKEPVSLSGISDELWTLVEPHIPKAVRKEEKTYQRKVGGGRPVISSRQVFSGIVYCLRTGCRWKAPPMYRFGSPSSINKYFHKWMRAGFFHDLWKAGIAEHAELEGIPWMWHSEENTITTETMAIEHATNKIPRKRKGLKLTSHLSGIDQSRVWHPAVVSRNKRYSPNNLQIK